MQTNYDLARKLMTFTKVGLAIAAGLTLALVGSAHAQTRFTFKSAKTTWSYFQMSVQIAEAIKKCSDGKTL